jgi:hypothetical protein
MRIAWVLGWAVPEAWFAPFAREAFPEMEHGFFASSPTWLDEVKSAGAWDVIVGHSLGTLLLLEEAAAVRLLAPRVVLLAPVFAFPQEEALGGKVARTQVRYLSRWLKTNRSAALADFYARAGLTACEGEAVAQSVATLQWGLDKLADGRVAPPLPEGWQAYVGANDALLDAGELRRGDPTITCVNGATHHPEGLIRALRGGVS